MTADVPLFESVGRCRCGHLDVFHAFGRVAGVLVRKGCGWMTGGPGGLGPCGCELYEEEVDGDEQGA